MDAFAKWWGRFMAEQQLPLGSNEALVAGAAKLAWKAGKTDLWCKMAAVLHCSDKIDESDIRPPTLADDRGPYARFAQGFAADFHSLDVAPQDVFGAAVEWQVKMTATEREAALVDSLVRLGWNPPAGPEVPLPQVEIRDGKWSVKP